MRVLQLIDTLHPGGAERMAVAIARGLADRGIFSALAVTRAEGALRATLGDGVVFFNCERKQRVDFRAVSRLRRFIKHHRIEVVHAHGTSFFIAFLLKLRCPSLRVVWHEHLGARSQQSKWQNAALFLCVRVFSHLFTVTPELEAWMKKELRFSDASFLPNFVSVRPSIVRFALHGAEGKRVVMVANLKIPKNHQLAVEAFFESGIHRAGWTLHLIGKDFQDDYSRLLRNYIAYNRLENTVFLYGEADASDAMRQCQIGLLTSDQEGFPVTLLEYAQAGLGVVTSNAGYAAHIVRHHETGWVFDTGNSDDCAVYLKTMAEDTQMRQQMAGKLKEELETKYAPDQVLATILAVYGYQY